MTVRYFKGLRRLVTAAKVTLALGSISLLGTCTPVPGLLEQIISLGEIRVVTRNGPLAFYRGAGDAPAGPEYELARHLASELGVRLIIEPVRSYAEIYTAITTGRAHVAAAGLKIPSLGVRGIVFGPVYQHVHEHVIYRRGSPRPASLADVHNADLEIVARSSHAATLYAARQSIPDLVWLENSSTDTQALLDEVASGSIDYTIADSTEFALAHGAHPELRIAFDFLGSQSLAWAISAREPGFLADVGKYFSRLSSSGGLSAILDRYYGPSENLDYVGARGFMRDMQSRLPLYRKWFEEAAMQSSEDWRLLAAIGYQESKWNPGASSPTGAKGLMQLTRLSALETKIGDPGDPRQSILGGARYFRQVYEKVPNHIPEPDRTWFALASYNIGYGHVEDARVLAQKAGKDPDSWRDVREFLPLLAEEFWYTQTENGYARGWEPVRYVDNVRGYRDILEFIWGDGVALN
jgi:membrane-bound lytic murein transglycosylase F